MNYGKGSSTVARCTPDKILVHVVELEGDVYAVCGTRVLSSCSSFSQRGVSDGPTVGVLYRLRGGASGNKDILSQWQCHVCKAQRCWPTRKRC